MAATEKTKKRLQKGPKEDEEEGNDDDEANLGEIPDVAIYKLASCIEFMGIDNNGHFVAYIVRSRWTQNCPGILRISDTKAETVYELPRKWRILIYSMDISESDA